MNRDARPNGWLQGAVKVAAAWRPLVAFGLLVNLLSVGLLAPISAWFLAAILRWSGDRAVSNVDLVSFFLTPQGLLLIVILSTLAVAFALLELGGFALIALGTWEGRRVSAVRTLQFLGKRSRRLVELGLRQFLVVAGLSAAVLVVAAVTKSTLLGGGDIYYYLTVRPPRYWLAVGLIATTATAAGIVGIGFIVRWFFAVPVLLLEGTGAGGAIKRSQRLVRETGRWRIVGNIAAWAVAVLLLGVLAGAVHGLLNRLLMAIAGENISWVIAAAALVVAIDLVLGLAVGVIGPLGFAVVVARLYADHRPETRVPESLVVDDPRFERRRIRLATATFGGALVLVLLAAVLAYSLTNRIQFNDDVAVTAHRGSSRAAPENTLAAVLRAAEDGADFSEIDVQQTADGVVVLLHDTDLRRVAGDGRLISEVTYDEARQMDVGSWFGEEFADQRVVSLTDTIEAARGRIKLNIEMKTGGSGGELAAAVARVVREASFEEGCIFTSLNHRSLQEIALHDDRLRRGLIVTAKIGDATNLDVDILAVNSRSVTRDLVSRAHRAGMELHVWTVNDPEEMLTMIHLGVDNILTSTPDVLVALLREREQLSNAEKVLLFVSDFLAGRV